MQVIIKTFHPVAVKLGTMFLCEKNKKSSPLAQSSRRIKRVVKYAVAADAVALSEECNIAYLMSELAKEVNILDQNREIYTYTIENHSRRNLGNRSLSRNSCVKSKVETKNKQTIYRLSMFQNTLAVIMQNLKNEEEIVTIIKLPNIQ